MPQRIIFINNGIFMDAVNPLHPRLNPNIQLSSLFIKLLVSLALGPYGVNLAFVNNIHFCHIILGIESRRHSRAVLHIKGQ